MKGNSAEENSENAAANGDETEIEMPCVVLRRESLQGHDFEGPQRDHSGHDETTDQTEGPTGSTEKENDGGSVRLGVGQLTVLLPTKKKNSNIILFEINL